MSKRHSDDEYYDRFHERQGQPVRNFFRTVWWFMLDIFKYAR